MVSDRQMQTRRAPLLLAPLRQAPGLDDWVDFSMMSLEYAAVATIRDGGGRPGEKFTDQNAARAGSSLINVGVAII